MVWKRLPLIAAVLLASPAAAEDKGAFDVLAYWLTLAPDAVAKSVTGDETIRLRLRQPAREISFTDNALQITDARVGKSTVAVRHEAGRLVFALPKPGRAGQRLRLRFRYAGQPKRGLSFEPGLIYTSYFTCDWMVCDQDRPGDKARFTLTLKLPPGASSIATGVSVGPHARQETRPYPAYLYGFAAGELTEVRLGGPRRLTAFGARRSEDDLRRLFAPTPDMVDFFQSKAGVALPSAGYWQLLTSAPEAQEGTGFAILGDEILRPMLENPGEDWAIAHELAHQWWGNLVTCETWRDFWLNEGFATFMTAAWKEHRWGRAAYDHEMDLARGRVAKAAAAGFDKPLAWGGTYPSLGTRRAVQYSKGALFLDALRTRLGEAAFWRAVQLYTRRHAGGTVTSADFQAAVNLVAPGKADDLFQQWVFAAE